MVVSNVVVAAVVVVARISVSVSFLFRSIGSDPSQTIHTHLWKS